MPRSVDRCASGRGGPGLAQLEAAWRGRFFGLWRALGMLLALVGGGAAVALLRARAWPTGFALCFGAAFACLAMAYASLAIAREGPSPAAEAPREEPSPARRWRAYAALLRRDPIFVAYLVATPAWSPWPEWRSPSIPWTRRARSASRTRAPASTR